LVFSEELPADALTVLVVWGNHRGRAIGQEQEPRVDQSYERAAFAASAQYPVAEAGQVTARVTPDHHEIKRVKRVKRGKFRIYENHRSSGRLIVRAPYRFGSGPTVAPVTAYLPTAFLSICGTTTYVGVVIDLDPACDDIAGCVNAGLLLAPDENGSYRQAPVPKRSCCGGG
jgi:hypothetical protein